MRKSLAALAVFAISTVPAVAQASSQTAPVEKPKTVTKVVCERVSIEQTTGSRVRSAPKRCKKVEVLAPSATDEEAQKAHSQGHSGNSH
ncbi:MAG: hypothetical protein ACR2JJ_07370 [Sphingomicrobium sp.]